MLLFVLMYYVEE